MHITFWIIVNAHPLPAFTHLSKTRGSFINWICGKLSHIFSSATFNSETRVFGFGRSASLPRYISRDSESGRLVCYKCAGLVEQHVTRVCRACTHLDESASTSLAAVELHSSIIFFKINNFIITVCKTLPLKLRRGDFISCQAAWYCFLE